MIYILRTGVAWEDLPERFGRPNSAHRRLRRWSPQGIWDELFLDGIPTDAPGTVVPGRGHGRRQGAARRQRCPRRRRGEEARGRSRGGLTTEIHALVDGLGRPLCLPLTPGQAADCRRALTLLEGPAFVPLIGGRGYGTDDIRDRCAERGRRGGDPIEAEPEGADPARPPGLQEPP